MIPVLYSNTVTSFFGNGIGLLSDIESCQCTEKLNDSKKNPQEKIIGNYEMTISKLNQF